MNTDSERALLVLGNGFDLAQGYNTRYSDFVKSQYFTDLVSKGNGFAVYLNRKNVQSNKWVDLEKELGIFSNFTINNEPYQQTDLKKDFKSLCQYLTFFIKGQIQKSTHSQDDINDRISDWKKNNKHLDIINLNYTLNCNALFNEKEIRKFHVHGQIETGIVLGVDENALNIINKDHTFLIKSRQQGYKVGELQKVIAHASKIIIFGCSLGETDYWYYKQLFSQNGSRKYEIYFHGDDELTYIKDQIHRIYGSCSDFESYHQVDYINSSEPMQLYGYRKLMQSQQSI